ALIEEGKGKILSEPKLVVKGGEEASFLVGGEIPIKSTTSVEGSTQEDTTYKAYGIGMTITPVIKNDTQVDIILNVEISDVDASNSTGTDVAFVTRTASTHLILEDGETNILAGLIRSQESERVRRIPFFSKIPIVGAAFRSKRNPAANTDQELIISLTPKILAYSKRKQKKMAAKNKKKAEQMMPNTKHGYRSAKPHYSGVANVMHEYIAQVQRKISQEANYPQEAIVYGLEGTVKLDLLILGDGTLAFALVKESSGHTIIDEYAVEAAKNMAPYDAFPSGSGLRELSVTIPLVYNLNSY
ncbi:MAG: TonB family protein, partial [Candidatus Omnitrophota bacterium]